MATNAENLDTAIAGVYAELARIAVLQTATISVRGHTYSLNEYRNSLIQNLKDLEILKSRAGGPWEIRTRAIT